MYRLVAHSVRSPRTASGRRGQSAPREFESGRADTIRGAARRSCAPASQAFRTVYEHNWERMIDHVDAVVLVMLVRLQHTVRVLGAGEQRVLPWLSRCKPIQLPTSPRMPSHRVQEFCLGP